MPVLLFLMGAATLALVASNTYAKAPKARRASAYTLDPNLEPALRVQVEAALNTEMDPARLEAFSHALEGRYPYASWYLRSKAEGLRRMGYGAPSAPALPTPPGHAPTGHDDGLDANLPDDVRFNVVSLLTMGTDPAMLEGFAAPLGAYPKAQSALRLRAAFLRSTAPAQPQPEPAPMFPALPGFDANLAPEAAMQIAHVLMTENDPSKLRALAAALQAQYPLAAAMLNAEANAIAPPSPPWVPAPVPSPGPVFAPSGDVPSPPAVTPTPPPAPLPAPPLAPLPPGLFDVGMTPEDTARIMTALASESDPAKLRALADSIASRYPNAALLLTTKAAAISAMLIPGGGAPPVVPTSFPPQPPTPVRSYKVEQGDFPIKIAKKFGRPESAWKELTAANPHKPQKEDGNFKQLLPGELIAIPASWPDRPGAQSAPSAPPPPGAMVPPGTTALDPGMPANVAQAVLTALASENDPAALRGFASSIMGAYPVAAGVLLAKANTLGIMGASGAATPVVLHLPSGGSPAPPAGERSYRVVIGDSPSRIAKKLAGSDARWPELVRANPQKAKKPDGNFKNLQPGELLTIPTSWTAAPAPNGAPAQAVRA